MPTVMLEVKMANDVFTITVLILNVVGKAASIIDESLKEALH